MDKVIYKDREISDWLDYIIIKFADKNYFEIEETEDKMDLTVKSKTNKTKICFSGLFDNKILRDCQYHNDDCKGWSGETTGADVQKFGSFNQQNVNTLERILDTPIYNGWISVDYYLFGKFYKAKTYEDKDKSKPPFSYLGEGLGCLAFILFPIFIPINLLMNFGIVGDKREVIIEPIIKKSSVLAKSTTHNGDSDK